MENEEEETNLLGALVDLALGIVDDSFSTTECITTHVGYQHEDAVDNLPIRQTDVTNLGKVELLEQEALFESATPRKLKRAVSLLRKRAGTKVKELKEESDLAQQTLAILIIAEEQALNEMHHDSGRIEHEPAEEDNLEHNLEVQQVSSVSDFWGSRNSPVLESSKVRSALIVFPTDDVASSMAGLTIGNRSTTTASGSEMEKFYRELELEMFGEDSPPSMVGRTLEVPGVEIPEEDRVYNDLESVIHEPSSVYEPDDIVYHDDDDDEELDHHEAPTSSYDSSRSYPTQQTFPMHHGYMSNNGYSAHVQSNDSCGQHDQGRSMRSRSLEYDTDCLASLRRQCNNSVESHAYYYYSHSQYHPQNVYPPQEAPMPVNPHPMNYRFLSSSLDNADVMRPHNMMHVQPHIHHPVPLASIRPRTSHTFGANDLPPMTDEQRRVPERHQVRPPRHEAQVRYCPPPTYLSPTHWMEDRDSPRVRHLHDEPVTITEEDSYEGVPSHHGPRNMRGNPRSYDSYRPTTFQRFPASFY